MQRHVPSANKRNPRAPTASTAKPLSTDNSTSSSKLRQPRFTRSTTALTTGHIPATAVPKSETTSTVVALSSRKRHRAAGAVFNAGKTTDVPAKHFSNGTTLHLQQHSGINGLEANGDVGRSGSDEKENEEYSANLAAEHHSAREEDCTTVTGGTTSHHGVNGSTYSSKTTDACAVECPDTSKDVIRSGQQNNAVLEKATATEEALPINGRQSINDAVAHISGTQRDQIPKGPTVKRRRSSRHQQREKGLERHVSCEHSDVASLTESVDQNPPGLHMVHGVVPPIEPSTYRTHSSSVDSGSGVSSNVTGGNDLSYKQSLRRISDHEVSGTSSSSRVVLSPPSEYLSVAETTDDLLSESIAPHTTHTTQEFNTNEPTAECTTQYTTGTNIVAPSATANGKTVSPNLTASRNSTTGNAVTADSFVTGTVNTTGNEDLYLVPTSFNIKTAIRFRPALNPEENAGDPWTLDACRVSDTRGVSFAFDRVLTDASTNKDTFNILCKDIVHACLRGFNGTIFAYGQTSSGKTHTMLGSQGGTGTFHVVEADPGIIPRAMKELFDHINNSTEREYAVSLSYLEVYNEKIIDLLDLPQVCIPTRTTGIGTASTGITNTGVGAGAAYPIRRDITIADGPDGMCMHCIGVLHCIGYFTV
eukprot:Lankesteria_metandrocarpae@DN3559_c0_g1_i2.p1